MDIVTEYNIPSSQHLWKVIVTLYVLLLVDKVYASQLVINSCDELGVGSKTIQIFGAGEK
jgi:hypothetical protein